MTSSRLHIPRPRIARIALMLFVALIAACSEDEKDRPDPTGPPGSGTGQLAIWTRANMTGGINVWLDGVSVGRLTMYFPSSTPTCGTQGTLTVTRTAGSHGLQASTSGGVSWEGTVDVVAGECNMMELTYTGGALRLSRTSP